jgi:hypothetical protein
MEAMDMEGRCLAVRRKATCYRMKSLEPAWHKAAKSKRAVFLRVAADYRSAAQASGPAAQ